MAAFFRFLLVALLVMGYARAPGQTPEVLPITRFSIGDGLSCRQTNKCIKDQRGFLWIATNDGLNRFDGSHFKMYRHIPDDTTSLSGNVVVNLAEDGSGNIWVMTTAGLCQFEVAKNRFRRYTVPGLTPEKKQYTLEPGFLLDGDWVWFSDYDGVNALHRKTRELKRYRLEPPFKGRMMIFLGKDAQHQVYAGSIEGTFRLDRRTGVFRRIPLPDPAASGLAITTDSRKKLWFCRWANGATAYDPQTGEAEKIGGNESLRQIFEVQPDSFWACGDFQGLLAFSRKDRVFRRLSFRNLASGLAENFTITSLASFGDGFIWLCSVEGLVRIALEPRVFTSVSAPQLGFKEPSHFLGMALEPGNPEVLWINTWYQNLVRYHRKESTLEPLFSEKGTAKNGLPWVNVYRIVPVDSQLWFVGHFGIWRKPPGSSLYQRLLPPGRDTSFLHHSVNSLKKLENGHFLAVSVGKGLVEFSPDFRFYREFPFRFKDLLNWDMRYGSLLEVEKDRFLLCSDKSGIIRFDKNSGTFTRLPQDSSGKLFPNFIQNMAREPNGRIWIASLEGLIVLDKHFRRIFEFSAQNGLPASRVYQILIDRRHRIWAATGEGLALWEPDNQTFRIFTKTDGLPDNQPDRIFELANGELATGHETGIAFFKPENLRPKPNPPRVVISDVLFENVEVPFLSEKQLTIPPEVGQIQIRFSAPEYGKPEGRRYFYRLSGLQDDWISLGANQQVTFFHLPPGEYRFSVKAISALGASGSLPVDLHFTVLTPWYKAWWFRLGLVGLLVAVVVAFYRYRIAQLVKLERVRMRISRDLHDDIGSSLSSINLLVRSAKRRFDEKDEDRLSENIRKIGERTQQILENMGDIIWSVKPENDSLERVASRMREFAASVLESRSLAFRIQFPHNLEGYHLPLEVKNNLFLIYKEAVNNLAKYSRAGRAEIRMEIQGGMLLLVICDNGVGFDLEKIQSPESSPVSLGGNGLRNMAQRAREMGAEFRIETAPGQGTTLSLRVPLK